MRQSSWLVEEEAPARPCAVCGKEATHVATYERPGNDPQGQGPRHGVGWQELKDLCEEHAKAAVVSEDRPRRLRRLEPQHRQKSSAEPLTLPGF